MSLKCRQSLYVALSSIMSEIKEMEKIINNPKMMEKTRELAIERGNELKEAEKTIKMEILGRI